MAAKKPPDIGELTPGSPEWMQAFDALSPQDQAAIFNQTTNEPTTTGFEDFGSFDQGADFGAPALAGTSFAPPVGMEDVGLDPIYQQLLQFGGGVNIPQYTAAGKLEPYDIGQEQARQSLARSQATSLADVIQASLTGPGGIDPGLFQPEVTMPTERLKTPGLDQAARYANSGGWEGYIAQKMLPTELGGEGLTDSEAVADLWNYVTAKDDPNIDPKDKAIRDRVIATLPKHVDTGNDALARGLLAQQGVTAPGDDLSKWDQIGVNKFASDTFNKIGDDISAQGGGWQDPNTGTWYTSAPTQEPSYMTNYFHKLGLPTPVAQYTDPDYYNQLVQSVAPNLDQTQAQRQSDLAASQANVDQLAAASNRASDFNTQLQVLMNDPRNRPTPGGLQAGRPGAQPMNSVTQFMAPGATQTPTPTQPTTTPGALFGAPPARAGTFAPGQLGQQNRGGMPAGPWMGGAPVTLTTLGSNQTGLPGPGPWFGQQPVPNIPPGALFGRPEQPERQLVTGAAGPGIPGPQNIAAAQTNAALTNMASQPNQPERAAINPLYTFGNSLSPQIGTLAMAPFAPKAGAVGPTPTGATFTGPKKIDTKAIAAAQKAADQARTAYERAYSNQFRNVNRGTPQDVLDADTAWVNANYAAQHGRTPFTDAMIQRLLGQRALGLRGY